MDVMILKVSSNLNSVMITTPVEVLKILTLLKAATSAAVCLGSFKSGTLSSEAGKLRVM